jgi:hypothetical protein
MKIFLTIWPRISTIFNRSGILLPLLFSILPATPAAAWGPVGHETVAYIAQDNLTTAAKQKIAAILDQGADSSMESAQANPGIRLKATLQPDALASISNWADEIRESYRWTAQWHFIDLPIRKDLTIKDEEDYCPSSNCVVDQL